ncbi:MAG: polysaccharide pyruvyl transferase family protein [Planctomycetota bacterium]|nr:polysaccharide pyruvyl transferase family protein [Planctomycetota bacterium]
MINLFCIRPKGFNVGNDAIFQGTRHFLYKAFGESINLITLPATAKYEGMAKAGLTAKTIYEINQYGHGVIIGGGNLFENGELDVDLDALKCLEAPLMLFSLSRGKVYGRHNQLVDRTDAISDRVIQGLDAKASFSLARDHATAEYMRQIGCKNCEVGGCPTIFLEEVRGRFPQLPAPADRDVLISIRNPQLMSIPVTRQAQVVDDVWSMVHLLRERGHERIKLLCHDHRDIAFAASFAGIDHVYTGDVYEYLNLLDECALNISYRLHSFLPCLSFGRPTIKISYDQRAISLVETVGFDDWNINMLKEPDVTRAVADRLDRMDDLSRMRRGVQGHWDAIYQNMEVTFRNFAAEVKQFAKSIAPCEKEATRSIVEAA